MGADVNEVNQSYYKMTSLTRAVVSKNEPLVSFLLQQPGIQVNAKDNTGWTALHYAASFCSGANGRKVIKLLLNFPGIDMEIRNNKGETPLMKATKENIQDFVEEYQNKIEDEKKKKENKNKSDNSTKNNPVSKKRKRETSYATDANMWKKFKNVEKSIKEALKKKEENAEELVKMEEKMVEELDKEFEDKMAALVKEKQEKRAEIAEKVKVKQERQAKVDQGILDDLEKRKKTVESELVAEMWKQVEEDEEGEDDKEEAINLNPPPPAPDCPICYEPMVPPTRIFQCGAGHLVCGGCKPKLQVLHPLSNHVSQCTLG